LRRLFCLDFEVCGTWSFVVVGCANVDVRVVEER